MDKSQLLELDASETVEYIRGVGMVKTKIQFSDYSCKIEWAEPSTHNITEILQPSDTPIQAVIRWEPDADLFCLEGQGQRIEFSGSALKGFAYCYEPPLFTLTVISEDEGHREYAFQIKDALCYPFRVAVERRTLGCGMKLMSHDAILQHLAQLQKTLKYAHGGTLAQKFCLFKHPRAASHGDAITSGTVTPTPKDKWRAFSSTAGSTTSSARSIDLPSGGKVSVGDLVLRLRDPESTNSAFKFDEADIFDGPFLVLQLTSHLLPLHTKHPPGSNANHSVKLDMPSDPTRGLPELNSWTPLQRVRKAYMIPRQLLGFDSSTKDLFRKSLELMASLRKTGDVASGNAWIAARLNKDLYVKVPYVKTEGLGNDVYEVGKLRGKRITSMDWRLLPRGFPRRTSPDSKDPAIARLLAQGGKVLPGQVSVVQYLVHWAGWPSEYDTWEVAWGNIPHELVGEFETRHREGTTIVVSDGSGSS